MNTNNTGVEEKLSEINMPMLALRGLVIFPGMNLHFDIGRKKSLLALNSAMSDNQIIFLLTQKDIRTDNPKISDLYKVGVVAKIRQVLKMTDESVRVLVEGLYRAKYNEVVSEEPFFSVEFETLEDKPIANNLLSTALVRKLQEVFTEYADITTKVPPDVVMGVLSSKEPGYLADYIASNINISQENKQNILNELHPHRRIELLISYIQKENKILGLEKEISNKVHNQIDKNQREYYLREQIKVISNELGENDTPEEESERYHKKINSLNLLTEVKQKLLSEVDKLFKMPYGSHEASVIRNYLDTCLELPWNKYTKERLDLELAQKALDKDHYGLEKVKERIIELLAVRKLSPKVKGQIICLIGPPGVGKTSIAKSIAKAMNRKYSRVSLGGVRDEADIRGHRKTYIGAMPGRILTSLKMAGSKNPLILLDEVDKLGNDFRGDPSSALLEVLDSEQNYAFRDHYLEIPFDLSDVLFITTANTSDTIPPPLFDRMEIINLSSYTREEKFNIAKKHLIPKQLKNHGLNSKNFKVLDKAIYDLIEGYTREAGVRTLERLIAALCRKSAKIIATGENKSVLVDDKSLNSILGPKKYKSEKLSPIDEIGVVNGLAWTSAGGEMMQIEVAILKGTGKLELTGCLGDVMKESAKAAISYIRSMAPELGIDINFYNNSDIHIHVPEGAIPKDGPSAGITIATALISVLTKRPVKSDVAMTGEITLRGRVLPIGGLKEKTMAAYVYGMKTVIIPKDNEPELAEISSSVKENISFVTVDKLDSVLKYALDSAIMQ